MMFRYTLILFFSIFLSGIQAQQNIDYRVIQQNISLKRIVSPMEIQQDWHFQLQNLEAPFQGNSSYAFFLNELKSEIARKYPRKEGITEFVKTKSSSIQTPEMVYGVDGNLYNGSAPNDNTMAISNDGILVSAINTNLIFYNTQNDSLLKSMSLNEFSDTLDYVSTHQYDPKLIYDYQSNRFILVFLSGGSSDTITNIIIAFSSTSNPMDDWYIYTLSGNPLNDVSWTDFPAIALSDDELFITGNLLSYGGSWQTSFKQSIIWQINKNKGYSGDSMQSKMYYDIKYGNTNLRNLHPVQGGDAFYGAEMYFLSNRNFDIQNDTFFLLKTSGNIVSNPTLTIKALKANACYGAPPNARQPGSKYLATNDARVLGAFKQNNYIQMVGNTIDTTDGKARIYHALINNLNGNPSVDLRIMKDSLLEFGYPNISYCGNAQHPYQSVISFEFTSFKTNPGLAAIQFDEANLYSDLKILKAGDTNIVVLLGSQQRWGDYSGSQIRFDKKNQIWISGTYGKYFGGRRYGTWICAVENRMTGISESSSLNIENKLFPNPSFKDWVQFEFSLEMPAIISIDLYDISGKQIAKIYQGRCKSGKNSVNFSTSDLSAGTYLLNVSSGNTIIISKKLLVSSK